MIYVKDSSIDSMEERQVSIRQATVHDYSDDFCDKGADKQLGNLHTLAGRAHKNLEEEYSPQSHLTIIIF